MSSRRPPSPTPHRIATRRSPQRTAPVPNQCNHHQDPLTEDTTVATATATPPRIASAPRRLSLGRMSAINAFWFGNGAHWQPLFIALVPEGAKLIVGSGSSDLLVGRATAAGGVFALIVPLLAGWLSDRTRTRWGRRRPWMVAGTVLNVIGLALLALAWSPALLIVFYLAVQAGNNVAGAAYSGVIPDVVPEEQRGRASGLLGTMNQLGTVVGILLIAIVFGVLGRSRAALLAGYAIVAVILVATLLITLVATREPVLPALPRTRRERPSTVALLCASSTTVAVIAILLLLTSPLGAVSGIVLGTVTALGAAGAVLSGRRIPGLRAFFTAFSHRDFLWCFITRCLMQFGIFSIVPFMDSYFQDVVGSKNSGSASSFWLLAVIAGGVVPAILGGIYSDRMGRRKVFVYASGAIQAVAASFVLFSLVSSTVPLYALGLLFGVGYGLYYAIDWALACDVLPDRENTAGRDMALWHISLTLPQVVAPTLAALLLTWLNDPHHHLLGIATGHNLGFRIVFGSAALWFVLGTVMVSRIRGVR
ncbi:MAG TPA: MFS transporter [Candidatus Dormibacteraeota bacterium]